MPRLALDGSGPRYEQIYRAIREAVLRGTLAAGARLPPTRQLAASLGVSRNTVLAAYEQLIAEGVASARVGAGTFIAAGAQEAPAVARADTRQRRKRPERAPTRYARALAASDERAGYDRLLEREAPRCDFRPCVPDLERLSFEAWQRTLARAAAALDPAALDYADPSGAAPLRRELAAYLARARGVECRPDQILVVAGVAQALDLTARLFVEPGTSVLIEEPHYAGARRCFEAAGAELVPGPVDREGIDLAAVPAKRLARCRVAYVTPSHQFPSGAVMSLPRRLELLRWAARADAIVIEDDYDSEFRYSGRAIEALKSLDEAGRVVYAGTFSKSFLPALRIGYLVVPDALMPLYRKAKWMSDWASPSFEQHALAAFLASGDFERHLRRARALTEGPRQVLLSALREELGEAAVFADSRAGLHVALRLPRVPREREGELLRRGRAVGLGLYSASFCYAEPLPCVQLLMGFARLDPAEVREGVRRLAGVVRELSA